MGMLIRKIPVYDFSQLELKPVADTGFLKGAFYLLFPELEVCSREKTLLSIPGALEIRIIRRSYEDELPEIKILRGEGCFAFNEKDEWILEVAFPMQNALSGREETFDLHLPMSAPFMQSGRIGLYYDGTWMRFVKDGEVLNENKGSDRFVVSGELFVDLSFAGVLVAPAQKVPLSYREQAEAGNADFYMPYGWNTFAGDVMNFYHDGTYHLLYLLDRRHALNWNGKAAHYIAQLTSENLIDWQEQELVAPIQHSWEAFGTGTLVWHHGKYYMSYGLHTERYVRTEDPHPFWNRMQAADFDPELTTCREVSYEEILEQGNVPTGSTYAVSEDGIHFTPSNKVYHAGRNPSIYLNEKGGLTLWSGLCLDDPKEGVWESPGFGEPFVRSAENWDCIKNPLIPYSTECPSLFTWNGHRYLIIGWSGYFRTKTPGADMFDAIAAGETVYDGLAVPMVTDYKDGRKLIAGWIRSIGWGSVILHRELIQETDGKLGMKWVPEMVPQTVPGDLLAGADMNQSAVKLEAGRSYLVTLTINPGSAKRMGIVFEDDTGKGCELQLDFEKKRVQFNNAADDALAASIPALYEMVDQLENRTFGELWRLDHIPQKAVNFCLPDVPGMEQTFTLRILCRCSNRMDSTVIDAEIAGRRTIVSGRHRLFPSKLRVLREGDARVTDAKMEALQNPVL